MLERAAARSYRYLVGTAGAEGLIARQEAGQPAPGDAELAAELLAQLLRQQDSRGSWGGDLVATAGALLALAELREAGAQPVATQAATQAALSWLRGRQGRPGRYGDGCTRPGHRLGMCHHFLAGFFAPAPPEVSLAGLQLPCGVRLEDDLDARLAASGIALQSALRWGASSRDIALHVEGLRRLVELWTAGEGGLCSRPALLAGLAALLEAPPTPENQAAVEHVLQRIASTQRADGTWREADPFQLLEVLLEAGRRGYARASIAGAVQRAAELLASSQQPDGCWGREAAHRRGLIGWRALRFVINFAPAQARPGP